MQQQPRLPLWFLGAIWGLIAGAFWLGLQVGRAGTGDLPSAQLAALAIVHREILQSHVDPQQADQLLERAIAGMVKGLDPYSKYVPPVEVPEYEERNTGHYQGIGADFDVHGDVVVLHFPMADSPAERAGLQPGDLLLAVDDTALDSATNRNRVVELVRGPAGSEVRLRLQRGNDRIDRVVQRGDVQKPCVKWAHRVAPDAQLGYVHLTDFHPNCSRQLFAAIDALQQDGSLRGLVLDLRWNGGGNLDECLAIARAFLPSGTIVTQFRRDREVVETHTATPETCRYPDLPLVLLVNDSSASASEVLAGALQDHGRAAIVGVRTHGKACVNTVYAWKNHDFRLKLTTGLYRTPKGRDIERHLHKGDTASADGGIVPDVESTVTDKVEARLYGSIQRREVPQNHQAAHAAVAAKYGFEVAAPPDPGTDEQVAKACEVLRTRVAPPPTNDPVTPK
ncbi:MAG: S41 family peptidase [Planctomycetes bacterium]|nr:S41 family peptidase [Planctomycetota bacterium]